MKYIILLDWIISFLMCFSIGCLFGAEYPYIPFMIWIGIIFVGTFAKFWLHLQMGKIENT